MTEKLIENMQDKRSVSLVVDRIEGEFAVCEVICKFLDENFDSPMVDLRLSSIPFEVSEEDVLMGYYTESNEITITSKKPIDASKSLKLPTRLVRFW